MKIGGSPGFIEGLELAEVRLSLIRNLLIGVGQGNNSLGLESNMLKYGVVFVKSYP